MSNSGRRPMRIPPTWGAPWGSPPLTTGNLKHALTAAFESRGCFIDRAYLRIDTSPGQTWALAMVGQDAVDKLFGVTARLLPFPLREGVGGPVFVRSVPRRKNAEVQADLFASIGSYLPAGLWWGGACFVLPSLWEAACSVSALGYYDETLAWCLANGSGYP